MIFIDTEIWVVPKEPFDFEIDESGNLKPFPITFFNTRESEALQTFYKKDYFRIWIITEHKEVFRQVPDSLFVKLIKFIRSLKWK